MMPDDQLRFSESGDKEAGRRKSSAGGAHDFRQLLDNNFAEMMRSGVVLGQEGN